MDKLTVILIILAVFSAGIAAFFIFLPGFSGNDDVTSPELTLGEQSNVSQNNESDTGNADSENNETNTTPDETISLDLEAVSIELTDSCAEYTNSTTNETSTLCDLTIKGLVKNSGSSTFTEDFNVYFEDITNEPSKVLIDVPKISKDLAPGGEHEISVLYEDLEKGRYTILFEIDQLNLIKEDNEQNNLAWKAIKI